MSVGGGGGGAPTSQTVTQTNIPEYARPYAEEMLGSAQALTDINQNPFQPYDQQRFAGFTPMQAQAFQNVSNQQVAPQLADASNLAYAGAQQGLAAQPVAAGLQQNALQYGGLGAEYGALGAMTAPQAQQYGAQGVGIGQTGVQAAQQGFGAGAQYAGQATSPEAMQAYMSPYMQNVVEAQQREATRASGIQQQATQSQAAQQGAFGGSRSAILEAERQRNLGTQLGDIQAAGLQRAYEQAQQAQQFGADLGLKGLQTGYGGLDVGLRGTETGLRGIQTGLQGTAQGIEGAKSGLQGVGQATSAGQYGLAGAQLGIQGAGALGQLGKEQYAQEMGITDALQKYGALQQGQAQQQRDFDYQQSLAQQQYPYQQLSYMSDLLRGVPSTQSAQLTYAQQPNQTAQLLGAGLGAYGALGRKEGGQIKQYQEGGQVSPVAMSTMAVQELPKQLKRLSDSQLAAYARTVKDAITLSAVQSEMSRRAKTRAPMGEMPQETVADEVVKRAGEASIGQPRVGMYGGGIVALQGGGQPFVTGMEEYGVDPATLERSRSVYEQTTTIPQGPYSGTPTAGAGAPYTVPTASPTVPPAQGDPELDDRASPVGIELLNKQPPPPAPKGDPTAPAPSGIMQAGRPQLPSTFEQFKAMIPKGEMDPAQASILSDMQSRLASKMERAEGQENTAKFDAILMAGLAMMGGTSLADGIARAAQTGGATYMAGMKDANKAIDAASDAELAFRQYELEVMKGNDKAASDQFSKFLDYSTKLYDIDSRAATASAKAGLSTRQLQTMLNADPDFRLLFDAEKEALKTARETAPDTDAQREAQARAEAARKARQDYERNYKLQALGISDSTAPAPDLPEGYVLD